MKGFELEKLQECLSVWEQATPQDRLVEGRLAIEKLVNLAFRGGHTLMSDLRYSMSDLVQEVADNDEHDALERGEHNE